jgi:hypothetical protein
MLLSVDFEMASPAAAVETKANSTSAQLAKSTFFITIVLNQRESGGYDAPRTMRWQSPRALAKTAS